MLKVKLIKCISDPIETIEDVASVCYDSEPSDSGKIARLCYESGHHSIFEFSYFIFEIEGISRVCANQLVRHRIASYCQRSQRYCKEDDFNFVIPHSISSNTNILDAYIDTMNLIQNFYQFAIDNGVPKEDARYSLPNSCETSLKFAINGRSLMNFIGLRSCTKSQWEIRELSKLIVCEIEKVYPDFAKYLNPKCLNTGFCNEKKPCGFIDKVLKGEQV